MCTPIPWQCFIKLLVKNELHTTYSPLCDPLVRNILRYWVTHIWSHMYEHTVTWSHSDAVADRWEWNYIGLLNYFPMSYRICGITQNSHACGLRKNGLLCWYVTKLTFKSNSCHLVGFNHGCLCQWFVRSTSNMAALCRRPEVAASRCMFSQRRRAECRHVWSSAPKQAPGLSRGLR